MILLFLLSSLLLFLLSLIFNVPVPSNTYRTNDEEESASSSSLLLLLSEVVVRSVHDPFLLCCGHSRIPNVSHLDCDGVEISTCGLLLLIAAIKRDDDDDDDDDDVDVDVEDLIAVVKTGDGIISRWCEGIIVKDSPSDINDSARNEHPRRIFLNDVDMDDVDVDVDVDNDN